MAHICHGKTYFSTEKLTQHQVQDYESVLFSVCALFSVDILQGPFHAVKSQPLVVGLDAPLIEDYATHACNPKYALALAEFLQLWHQNRNPDSSSINRPASVVCVMFFHLFQYCEIQYIRVLKPLIKVVVYIFKLDIVSVSSRHFDLGIDTWNRGWEQLSLARSSPVAVTAVQVAYWTLCGMLRF